VAETIEPTVITNFQELEVAVNGPGEANRMFIYSGMIDVSIPGGIPHPRWSQEIISFTIGREYADGEEVLNIAAVAGIGACRTDGMASFAGWRIYAAAGEWDEEEHRVRLDLCVGARDTQAYLEQVIFQAHVLAKVN
jgi:hypothetical protein